MNMSIILMTFARILKSVFSSTASDVATSEGYLHIYEHHSNDSSQDIEICFFFDRR